MVIETASLDEIQYWRERIEAVRDFFIKEKQEILESGDLAANFDRAEAHLGTVLQTLISSASSHD